MGDDADSYSYKQGLLEFYRGEVIGEAITSDLLAAAKGSAERMKLAHLLQLETETKAWLRPHMIRAGLSIVELEEWRDFTKELAARLTPLAWPDLIGQLAAAGPGIAARFEAFAEAARNRGESDQAAVCDFMVAHEQAIGQFFELELAGAEPAVVLEPLMRHSRYPLPVA
jgi:hypothetical protein